jgi:hypothetical protein
MNRRHILAAALALPAFAARAHHGWSSFDQDRPIYLEGRVTAVRWQNPHAELEIELPPSLRLPADLASRALPAQSAQVDGKALLARTGLPTRKDRKWEIELAPLTRIESWKLAPIPVGAAVSIVGFTLRGEQGDAVLRAEYLFVDGRAYAFRSGPA